MIVRTGGSFFLGPALAFVPIEGERALQLHHLALQALQLALPHADNSDMGSEIVLVNLAKSLCDLGHFEKAAAAASRALECRGLPGAVRSFASNSIGRAAEAEGDAARAAAGPRAPDTLAHYERAKAAYREAVEAAGEKGDPASATAFVRVQVKAAAEGTFHFGASDGNTFFVRAMRAGVTLEMAGGTVVQARADGTFPGLHPAPAA